MTNFIHSSALRKCHSYLPAILSHFGLWVHPERRQDKGPWPKPRWLPLPGLRYAQVVKQYRRKRMAGVKHRVVFGTIGAIEQVLAAYGWKINTAFVERLNLDIRQRVAAVGRPGQHAVPGRGRLAASAGIVPRLPQLRLATYELAPTVAGACIDQRRWAGKVVAAVYAGDGGWVDRSRVDAARGADVSGATLVTTSCRVKS